VIYKVKIEPRSLCKKNLDRRKAMTELFRILRNLNLDTEELRPDFNMSN
jgi:hypothetical protein